MPEHRSQSPMLCPMRTCSPFTSCCGLPSCCPFSGGYNASAPPVTTALLGDAGNECARDSGKLQEPERKITKLKCRHHVRIIFKEPESDDKH